MCGECYTRLWFCFSFLSFPLFLWLFVSLLFHLYSSLCVCALACVEVYVHACVAASGMHVCKRKSVCACAFKCTTDMHWTLPRDMLANHHCSISFMTSIMHHPITITLTGSNFSGSKCSLNKYCDAKTVFALCQLVLGYLFPTMS